MSPSIGARTRRQLLGAVAAAGACVAIGGALPALAGESKSDDVSPGEDLMREHGVLRRVMFVYDEGAHRLETGGEVSPPALARGAGIVRRVIQDYHEKLEERHVFPRLERKGRLSDLVATLRTQHGAGRKVIDRVLELGGGTLDRGGRAELAAALRAFNRMYRPHAAREDTVLFPAFHELVGTKAYAELGERFEEEEHRALGEEGFEKAVVEVAALERELGMDDLARFTPRA